LTNQPKNISDFCFSLLIELRKEVIESQKIRAQVIGFKITFVSAGIAVILANLDKLPPLLLAVPAFAAIFFDFLINSYSFSIKRIGYYCRNNLEPYIRKHSELDKSFLLWEEFLRQPGTGQIFATVGNLGLTLLAVVPAVIGLLMPFRLEISVPLIIILALLLYFNVHTFLRIGKMREAGLTGKKPSRQKSSADSPQSLVE